MQQDSIEPTEINESHGQANRVPTKALHTNLIATVAITWSIFQLAVAQLLTLNSTWIRGIHLAFALSLLFLSKPMLRRAPKALSALVARDGIPVIDIILAILSALAALYIVFDYQGISQRAGLPIPRDIAIGLLVLVLLLEACRRAIGPALVIIALAFCGFAFFSDQPWIPSALMQKSVSLARFIGQMTMSDEGIYGTPLRVSAQTVFLFVLFGAMLDRAGGGRYFTELSMSMLGGFRGGPAKAAVLSSGLTGMASGSSIANIVTTGTFTIPMMKKAGYPATKAAAIEVAASTDGQLAPPVMGAAAFIIAEYVGVSYLDVIKAAAIPAFASYATLLYITHIEACKLGLKRIPRSELPPFWITLRGGLHFMLPVGFLMYQLMIRRRTPEFSAYSALGLMTVVMLGQCMVQSHLQKRGLWHGLRKAIGDILAGLQAGAHNMVSVALATAGAGIIVGIVSLGLGSSITQFVEIISLGSVILMLCLTAIASLLIGMGLPTTATYITMASLLAPVIVSLGASHELVIPIMAAHLFCFYFGILADDTPPVGLAAYAAAAIAKSPPIATGIQGFMYDIRTAILPFMFVLNPDLILHGIDSWPFGLMIFALACIGNFAFAAATQGWCHARNRFYDIPILLSVTMILLRPDLIARLLNIPHEMRYWTCLIGLSLFALVYIVQWKRSSTHRDCRP